MGAYLLRRMSYMLVVLLVVSFLAFEAIQLQPGDCGGGSAPETAQVWTQYALWLQGVFQGNLGISCSQRIPVTTYLFRDGAWARSLILDTMAFLLSWGIGVPLGLYAALRRGRLSDHLVRSASASSLALPPFLVALLLILLFYQLDFAKWGWEVAGGAFSAEYLNQPRSWAKLLNGVLNLIPPLLVVVLAQWAVLTRHMRAYLLDVFNQPYIQVARAKGLSEGQVNYKHALRNALHPLIGLMGFWLPSLFESILAVAIVMNYPTVELNLWHAILLQDQYVVAGGLLVLGAILMLGTLLADLALARVDPRIRYE